MDSPLPGGAPYSRTPTVHLSDTREHEVLGKGGRTRSYYSPRGARSDVFNFCLLIKYFTFPPLSKAPSRAPARACADPASDYVSAAPRTPGGFARYSPRTPRDAASPLPGCLRGKHEYPAASACVKLVHITWCRYYVKLVLEPHGVRWYPAGY